MATPPPARILLCAERTSAVEALRRLLETEGHATDWRALDAPSLPELAGYDLIILEAGRSDSTRLCQRLGMRSAELFLPCLFLAAGEDSSACSAALESGVDACLVRPFGPEEFLAQVRALLRLKKRYDRLAGKVTELGKVHQQLQQAYQQMDRDLTLARRLQQRLRPRTLPDLPGVHFAVHARPCSVGSAVYEVCPLDGDRVRFYLADVIGEGIPASLLIGWVKEMIRREEQDPHGLPRPEAVLEALNRELRELALPDNPFITMIYAVFDGRQGTVTFARAGHPHPIHLPRGGTPRRCPAAGTLLGLFEAEFTPETVPLRPGDKWLLHSDGLDALAGSEQSSAAERLLTAAERHGLLPIDELVSRLAQEIVQQEHAAEEFTLLGLQVRD